MSTSGYHGGTLTDLADQLPSAPANFLPSAGPASEQVLDLLRNETLTQPFLATLFWHAFVRTRWYGVALGRAGVSGIGQFDRIVVPHDGGNRFDLVVLVPGYQGDTVPVMAEADPRDLTFEVAPGPARALAQSVGRDEPEFGGRRARRVPPGYQEMLGRAVAEVAQVQEFGLIVAPAPDLEPLSGVAAQPSVPVYDAGGTVAASVGVFQRDGARVLATTALHAVQSRQTVPVGTGSGTVISRDPVTDSCLLELDHDPFPGGYGLNGCSRIRPPRQYIQTAFDGAGSAAPKTTTLHGFDESILDVQPFLATKLYTHPDTVPGDSGSALVEPSSDEVLGFAAYRSSMASAQRFSAWVWAEQVYDALGL